MTNEERIDRLRSLITSPVWLEIIEPAYRERLAREVEALVEDASDEEARRGAIGVIRWALTLPFDLMARKERARQRGRIRALRSLLTWPINEVEQDVLDKERIEAHNAALARWTHYATYGFHSPLAPPMETPESGANLP